jgi:hypothetical protein
MILASTSDLRLALSLSFAPGGSINRRPYAVALWRFEGKGKRKRLERVVTARLGQVPGRR